MYYFGTNLENRFSVPDFWPKPEETYRIPFEKQEIQSELKRLEAKRLERRKKRLEAQGEGGASSGKAVEGEEGLQTSSVPPPSIQPSAAGASRNASERGDDKGQQAKAQGKSWWSGLW